MQMSRRAIFALLFFGLVQAADQSVPPQQVSTNPADAPARVKTGKVFASTDANLPPALGPVPAKVVVMVFSDFQCPVCRRCADATQQIAEEFPGDVRVEFWQHALSSHANAENAAVASLAAQRQGRFWEYHDEVFRNQQALDLPSLNRYAESLGLDMATFSKDYADPALRERVRAEGAFAERFAATSTPAFVINGKVHIGWGSWSGFRTEVQRELAEADRLEGQGVAVAEIAEQRAHTLIADASLATAYCDSVLRAAPEPPKKSGSKKSKGTGKR
jgi:protein-disulfide isomerase